MMNKDGVKVYEDSKINKRLQLNIHHQEQQSFHNATFIPLC